MGRGEKDGREGRKEIGWRVWNDCWLRGGRGGDGLGAFLNCVILAGPSAAATKHTIHHINVKRKVVG